MTTKKGSEMMVMLEMDRKTFIKINREYLDSINKPYYILLDDKGVIQPTHCPLNLWVVYNHAKCGKELVNNTTTCPLCDNYMCPDCMNHFVEPQSRVTGYMGGVSGWNVAKQQEFKDRSRYNL